MANLTPAQKSVVQAMMGSFGSRESLTGTSPLPSGPLRYDTSGGMTPPTGPTLGSRPVISEPGSYEGLRSMSVMYHPASAEANNPDPFSHLNRLPASQWATSDMRGGVGDVSGIGVPGMNQNPGILEAWRRPPAENPAVAAIGGATRSPPMLPRRRPDVLPTEIMRRAAVQGFNPNAILARSQDPATRAMQTSMPGTGGPMLGPRTGTVSRAVGTNGYIYGKGSDGRYYQQSTTRAPGVSPGADYARINAAAAARAPMSAFERSQARNAAAESEARSLNNFSG